MSKLFIPTSIVSLLALAGYLWYYWQKHVEAMALKKLEQLPAEDRIKMVEMQQNDFGTTINTDNLSPEHKVELIKEQIRAKRQKFNKRANVFLVLVAFSLSILLAERLFSPNSTLKTEYPVSAQDTSNINLDSAPKQPSIAPPNRDSKKRGTSSKQDISPTTFILTGKADKPERLQVWTIIKGIKYIGDVDSDGVISLQVMANKNDLIEVNFMRDGELKKDYLRVAPFAELFVPEFE